jgi:hypothetical protein
VTRIGHGGSDPGVMTEMLSNLDKDVAIVLFSNTSVPERDGKKYLALVTEVWNHAEALRSSTRSPVR